MAYNYVANITKLTTRNRTQRLYRVDLVETDVQSTSEAVVLDLPQFGIILRYKATIDGIATINPGIGTTASWVALSQDEIAQNDTANVHIDNQEGVKYYSALGQFVIRSTPSVDGFGVVTEILIAEGWDF